MAGITRTTRLGLFVLGFLAATGVEAVRADVAYLCDAGRIVKVPFGKLEDMKRTDPCVAAYYGLTVGNAQPLETGAIAPTRPVPAQPSTSPAIGAPAGESAALGAEPKPLNRRNSAAVPAKPPRPVAASAPPAAPRTAPGTDYRNVVLLNAAPGAPTIYLHDR